MTKLFYTLLLLGCVVCTAISCRPEAKQAGQVNIPLYRMEVQQQELVDRGYDIKVDGKFGPNTEQALNDALWKE